MPPNHHRALALPLSLLASSLALAQENNQDQPWIGGAPFSQWQRFTGNWGGYRDTWESHGVIVSGGYTADSAAAWSGGLSSRSAWTSLLDVNVAFDLETLLGLPRTLAYADAYQIAGQNPSNYAGDFQGLSNIASDDTAQIAELWLETWIGDHLRLKLGKVDFNSEFAFAEYAGEFVHSTPSISPCIVGYATYPNPATSCNLFYTPDSQHYVGLGVYDGSIANGVQTGRRGPSTFFDPGSDGGYLVALEFGRNWAGGGSWGSGRLAVGAFWHTARFTSFDGEQQRGSQGLWCAIDQRLWREHPDNPDDGQGLNAFVSLGYADDAISPVGTTIACGLTWVGALRGRDHDAVGLMIAHANLSNESAAGTPRDETAFELFYKIQLTPSISLKPDLQYIRNPGGTGDVDNAVVGLLRLEILF